MKRRYFLVAAGGLVVAGIVPAVRAVGWNTSGSDAASADAAEQDGARSTAAVTRRDLAETRTVTGTLGYGAERDVAFGRPGTITALPALGTTVDRGALLGEVDGTPVVLFYGDRPLWRVLQEGVEDGPDVEQLEANLIELGYGTAANLGPNQVWSQATTAAVKRWQKALGLAETGVVAPGDVVFEPGPVRIAAHAGTVGASAGGPALRVTDTTRIIDVDLDATLAPYVHAQQSVAVVLPDEASTTGTVAAISAVATAGAQGSAPTVPVTITLDDQTAGGGFDQAPVSVTITTTHATDVLAVPVAALLALAEGGYAVEKVGLTGTSELVAVTAGAFADGWVEVTGDLIEGDKVVTAS